MYDRIDLKDNNDYFLKFEKRPNKNGVYFFRYIGYSDSLLNFLKSYEEITKTNGAYISPGSLANPSGEQVNEFLSKTSTSKKHDATSVSKDIANYMPILNQNQKVLLTDSMCEMLNSLSKSGMNENMIHNSYIKFMCWSYNYFFNAIKAICKDAPPKILYEGDIKKYDVYMLRILSRAGCDVLYFNTDDDSSYVKWDNNNSYSKPIYGPKKGAMLIHFSKLNSTSNIQQQGFVSNTKPTRNIKSQMTNNISVNNNLTNNFANNISSANNINIKTDNSVSTNTWIEKSDNLFDVLYKTNNTRCLTPMSSTIYNLYAAYLGIDTKDEYNNRLCDLKENLQKHGKPFVIIENHISNPLPDEVAKLKRFQPVDKNSTINALAMQINVSNNLKINALFQQAFINIMEQTNYANLSKLYNDGNKQLCWIMRYLPQLFKSFDNNHIPCIIFFGKCDGKNEISFFKMLSMMPLDVFNIDPQHNDTVLDDCLKLSLPNTSNDFDKYPDSKCRVRVATTAYSAEKELDTVLYSGTGLYRQHQFLYSKPVTLKTTFEEIELLWKEEAKYRPAFEIKDNNEVILPNIFAKVCGVKNNDITQYIKYVRNLMDENTIIIDKFPYINTDNSPFRQFVKGFHNKNEVAVDFIKKHQSYRFDYLSENIQETIFSKMQELINLDWINTGNQTNIVDSIICTILALDKKTLQIIQQFDFTKKLPKLILVSVTEAMFSLEDCIYICFLNLIGFDIIIFTPTGYRNIEKYVTENIFEQYIIGDYKYDINPLELKALTVDTNKTLFRKFFKRR